MTKRLYFLLLLLMSGTSLVAQSLFQPLPPAKSAPLAVDDPLDLVAPATYSRLTDPAALSKQLPLDRPTELTLPTPGGGLITFRLQPYEILGPDLRAFLPGAYAAHGYDPKRPDRSVSVTYTPAHGLRAIVQERGAGTGSWQVRPLGTGHQPPVFYRTYRTRDLAPTERRGC